MPTWLERKKKTEAHKNGMSRTNMSRFSKTDIDLKKKKTLTGHIAVVIVVMVTLDLSLNACKYLTEFWCTCKEIIWNPRRERIYSHWWKISTCKRRNSGETSGGVSKFAEWCYLCQVCARSLAHGWEAVKHPHLWLRCLLESHYFLRNRLHWHMEALGKEDLSKWKK